MPITYNGVHSILFLESSQALSPGGTLTEYTSLKHTWRDLHLVPKTRPFVETPEANISMYSDTVSSKVFDVTDAVAGGQTFDSRKGTWDFYVDHDKWNNWYTAKNTIEDYLNGKRLYCCLMDDPSVLYYGRFTISSWDDGSDYSSVSIEYDLDWDTYIADDYNKPISLSATWKQNTPLFYEGQSKNIIKDYLISNVYYNNGTYNVAIDDIPGTFSGTGVQNITIKHTETGWSTNTKYTVSTTISVTVGSDALTSISASYKSNPPTVYVGDSKDIIRQYINVTATYRSGEITVIDGSEVDVISGTFTSAGTQDVNINYGGKTTAISISVADDTLVSISASYKSNPPTVYVGNAKDIIRQYINITATYVSGKNIIFDGTEADYINGAFTSEGAQNVTITYSGKSTTISITVSVDEVDILDYIEVAWKDNEPVIYVGQAKNTVRQYITLTATYKSGRKESNISGNYTDTISGAFETSGLQSVTITYMHKTASISLTIIGAADLWDAVKQSIITGTYATDYPLGSKVPIAINGETNNAVVVGIDTDADENGNAIPLTFITEYYIDDSVYMNDYDTGNVDGYPETYVKKTYLENVYTTLDSSVKSIIVPAVKKSRLASILKTTVDKLWIPSTREIIPDLYPDPEWEGPTYGSMFDTAEKRIKKSSADGVAKEWWLRTTGTTFGPGGHFIMIYKNGEDWLEGNCNGQHAIVLGFCVGNPSNSST